MDGCRGPVWQPLAWSRLDPAALGPNGVGFDLPRPHHHGSVAADLNALGPDVAALVDLGPPFLGTFSLTIFLSRFPITLSLCRLSRASSADPRHCRLPPLWVTMGLGFSAACERTVPFLCAENTSMAGLYVQPPLRNPIPVVYLRRTISCQWRRVNQ